MPRYLDRIDEKQMSIKKKRLVLYFNYVRCICESIDYLCVGIGMSEPLGLELWVVVKRYISAGNQAWVLCRMTAEPSLQPLYTSKNN